MRIQFVWPLIRSLIVATIIICPAQAQEIWFAPHAPGKHYRGPLDWGDVFQGGARWQTAASHVRVLLMPPGYFEFASDEELKTVGAYLAARGAAFGVSLQAIDKVPGEKCGGIEGYGSAQWAEALGARLSRLKIEVRDVEPDEPLWFGHFEPDPRACRLPIGEVARRVASTLKSFLQYYPNAALGDIEPAPPLTREPGWQQALSDYYAFLESALGRKTITVQVDVAWNIPSWPNDIKEISNFAHDHGLRLGIIYNGDKSDATDNEWIDHARRNFEQIEGEYRVVPDEAVFASWTVQPEHILPETSPSAHTSLILSYLRGRTYFQSLSMLDSIAGRLVDAQGHGIADAPISLSARGIGSTTSPLPVLQMSGVVPEMANHAIFVLNINPRPYLSGDNDILMGDLAYRESGAGASQQIISLPSRIAQHPDVPISKAEIIQGQAQRVVHLVVAADQSFHFDSGRFPVTPGAQFTLEGPMALETTQGMFGQMDIVWLDADGHAVQRSGAHLAPTFSKIESAKTDSEGRFTLSVPKTLLSAGYRLVFAGTDSLRSAYADLR